MLVLGELLLLQQVLLQLLLQLLQLLQLLERLLL